MKRNNSALAGMKQGIQLGVEDTSFGALLGLWVAYITYQIQPSSSGLPADLPFLVVYLMIFITTVVIVMRVAFAYGKFLHRALCYIAIILGGFFGTTGIKGSVPDSATMPSWAIYWGLAIIFAWILAAEVGQWLANLAERGDQPIR